MVAVTRRWWLLASVGAPMLRGLAAPALHLRLDGSDLRVTAPHLKFLTGKPLERLKDGASVAFLAQFSLAADANAAATRRAVERFVISYDLWEEKFSVAQTTRERHSISHLTAAAAEAWCLDRLALNVADIAPERPFWIRLELRAEDPKDQAAVVGEPGINLTRLIEVFSNPARALQPHWEATVGPVRLADLPRQTRVPPIG
jgi:hypothetical protein